MQADLCVVLKDLIVFKPLCQRIRREAGGFRQLGVARFPEMTPDIGFGDAARPLESAFPGVLFSFAAQARNSSRISSRLRRRVDSLFVPLLMVRDLKSRS